MGTIAGMLQPCTCSDAWSGHMAVCGARSGQGGCACRWRSRVDSGPSELLGGAHAQHCARRQGLFTVPILDVSCLGILKDVAVHKLNDAFRHCSLPSQCCLRTSAQPASLLTSQGITCVGRAALVAETHLVNCGPCAAPGGGQPADQPHKLRCTGHALSSCALLHPIPALALIVTDVRLHARRGRRQRRHRRISLGECC